jgi:diguanylate cyclase (GGDEF)-like protein
MEWKNEKVSQFLNYEQLISILDECTSGCIFIYDLTNDHYSISQKAVETFELESSSFDNALEKLEKVIYPEDMAVLSADIKRITRDKKGKHDLEYRWYNRQHEPVWISCKGETVYDSESDTLYLIGSVTEIGNAKRYDNITSLFSEMMLECRYNSLQSEEGNTCGYILLVGVDNFKAINEKHGIKTGDGVLADVAKCIVECVGGTKNVFRLKGDEFAVLYIADKCKIISDESDDKAELIDCAKILYKKIRHKIDKLIKNKNYNIFYTISGGASLFSTESDTFENVMQNVKFALHEAKKRGRNTFVPYSDEHYKNYIHIMDVQENLRNSIIHNFEGFEVYYQPIYSTSEKRINGAEALIRWNSKKYGFMSPVEFVPLLEESSLIIPLGRWIIRQAASQCKKWIKYIPDFIVHINLSFVQIIKSDIVKDALKCINEQGLSHKNIVFEITESGELESNPMVRNVLCSLEELGFKLAIDDFGTGYSNLRYIRDMTFRIIKVDRMFVQNIDKSEDNYALVKYIIDMAHTLGISVCVEGVETEEELSCVLSLGADFIQGYYYGKPVPVKEFEGKFLAGEPL